MVNRIEVSVDDGKYTWIVEDGRISCLRYGEQWISYFDRGSKALIALIYELEQAKEKGRDHEGCD